MLIIFPFAGNYWGGNFNNEGNNGNLWGSSLYAGNDNNAYNLWTNSDGNCNDSNNNRNNSFPVRGVLALCLHMNLSKEQLLLDLYAAFYKARKGKRKRRYVIEFEKNLHENLIELRDSLWNRIYKPLHSYCFIINHPKKREVFAAAFRDRIVHHLYFEYAHEIFERTFIADTYSCIKGRGTHYGIERLKHHILSESRNYTRECYILKIDIRGYFMNIDRNILLDAALKTLEKSKKRRKDNDTLWRDAVDYSFIEYLTREIVLLNPLDNCVYVSPKSEYEGLPKSKILANSPKGCGMPIGNLTSQLLSNVYLNLLDQFVKRILKCKHYGRYVDDAYIVSCDRNLLKLLIPQIRSFLKTVLHLDLQEGKIVIKRAKYGIEFLGAYIKPFRTYASNQTLRRMVDSIADKADKDHYMRSMASKMGILSHYRSRNVKVGRFMPLTI